MIASRRNFLAGFGSLLAAPAIVRAESLMKVHQIPDRLATVWGVGWDLEVVEHVIWTPKDAWDFAKFGRGGIDKFREVTEVVHAKPLPPVFPYPSQQRTNATQEWFANQRKAIVDDATGFTNVVGYGALKEWQASQRPDLEPPGSMDWAYEQIRLERQPTSENYAALLDNVSRETSVW